MVSGGKEAVACRGCGQEGSIPLRIQGRKSVAAVAVVRMIPLTACSLCVSGFTLDIQGKTGQLENTEACPYRNAGNQKQIQMRA